MKKIIIALGAVVVLGGLALGAMNLFDSEEEILAGSSEGTTFSTARVASQVVSNSTSTLFAVLNTDASDRFILGADIFLTGGQTSTSSSFRIACATSSIATGFSSATPNFIYNQIILADATEPFGTTTSAASYAISTSSPGITGTTTPLFAGGAGVFVNQFARVWKTNTYLVCQNDASGNATDLLPSLTTGTISFPYRAQ